MRGEEQDRERQRGEGREMRQPRAALTQRALTCFERCVYGKEHVHSAQTRVTPTAVRLQIKAGEEAYGENAPVQ